MTAAKKAKKVDVRKADDVKDLQTVIQMHPITIILIHADWCGHCQRYKENVWNKLHELPNRKNGLAAIHHDQLEGTEFRDARFQGYPSIIVVGKKKMAEFEDENGVSNAIPTEDANDFTKMSEIVSSAEPSTLTGSIKNMKTNVDMVEAAEDPIPQSPELSENAKLSRKTRTPKTSSATPSAPVVVPDPTQDVLDTQNPVAASLGTEFGVKEEGEPKKGGGGSLYHSLLAATRDVAPAAALVAAAVVMKRGGKRTRRAKKGKRSGRKSRKN